MTPLPLDNDDDGGGCEEEEEDDKCGCARAYVRACGCVFLCARAGGLESVCQDESASHALSLSNTGGPTGLASKASRAGVRPCVRGREGGAQARDIQFPGC